MPGSCSVKPRRNGKARQCLTVMLLPSASSEGAGQNWPEALIWLITLMLLQVIGVSNPSTPESALIDMRLLSECNEVVVTVGSSYGSVAAGMGGIVPVQMIHGHHQNVQVSRPTCTFWRFLSVVRYTIDTSVYDWRFSMHSLRVHGPSACPPM